MGRLVHGDQDDRALIILGGRMMAIFEMTFPGIYASTRVAVRGWVLRQDDARMMAWLPQWGGTRAG